MPGRWDLTQLNLIIARPGPRRSRNLRRNLAYAGMTANPRPPVLESDGETGNGKGGSSRQG
jgi:hypothetical protein